MIDIFTETKNATFFGHLVGEYDIRKLARELIEDRQADELSVK